jgi:hypothetical protein
VLYSFDDVGIINALGGTTLSLDCASTFASSAVTRVAGTGTIYTCSYTSPYTSILNVSASQSFTVEGGILVCGSSTNENTQYFTIVNGENAYFCFSGVELKYKGQMGSIVYVRGGTVRFDNVKMNKQDSFHWVNPLIDVNATISTVNVYILSTNITNNDYHYTNTSTSLFKSGVIFFVNTSTKAITLNMRGSSFLNNSFNISNNTNARGGVCVFNGPPQSVFFFYFLYLYFYF